MSNRLLGVFVMISIIGAGYLYYSLKYIPYKHYKIQAEIQKEQAKIEKQQEPKLTKQIIEKKKLSNAEKIDELRSKKKYYKFFKLSNGLEVSFVNNEESLDLFYNKSKIGNFPIVYPKFLTVSKIEGTINDLFIIVGSNKYIFNNNTKEIEKIELNIGIEYVKTGTKNELIFVTEKGSFVYSLKDKSLEYFSYFNDFIYYNEGYVGIVGLDENRIRINLGFEDLDNNLVVYYNSKTKEKKIVYETSLDIKKIYSINNRLYLVMDNGEVFELENIK